MLLLADFDPIGLGSTASVLILGALILLAIIGVVRFFKDDTDWSAMEYDPTRPVDEGIVLTHYVAIEDLLGIADQRNILPNPAWMERGESRETSAEASAGAGGAGGRFGSKRTTDSRAHYDMPRDITSLVPKVLRALADQGELDRGLPELTMMGAAQHPVLTDPAATTEFVNTHLDERYADGIDEPMSRVVERIVSALHQHALEELIEGKRSEFKMAAENPRMALVEGDWRISVHADELVLRLDKFVRRNYDERFHEFHVDPEGAAVPSGLGIVVRLDARRVTERGKRELVSGEVRRLGVFGTTARVDGAGVLELVPIVVFSRVEGRRY